MLSAITRALHFQPQKDIATQNTSAGLLKLFSISLIVSKSFMKKMRFCYKLPGYRTEDF